MTRFSFIVYGSNRTPPPPKAMMDASAAQQQYSHAFVSDLYKKMYPSWQGWSPIPMRPDHAGMKLSPQSGKFRAELVAAYGTENDAWNAGWRWELLPHNHQWYPPAHTDPAYNALVEELGRFGRGGAPGKNKGSLSTPGAAKVLQNLRDLNAV